MKPSPILSQLAAPHVLVIACSTPEQRERWRRDASRRAEGLKALDKALKDEFQPIFREITMGAGQPKLGLIPKRGHR